jgi:hypothetical protein
MNSKQDDSRKTLVHDALYSRNSGQVNVNGGYLRGWTGRDVVSLVGNIIPSYSRCYVSHTLVRHFRCSKPIVLCDEGEEGILYAERFSCSNVKILLRRCLACSNHK